MLVYRVEHKDSFRGPYNHGLCLCKDDYDAIWFYEFILDLHCGGNWPIPAEDGINHFAEGTFFFGFSSQESLFRWFEGLIELLEVFGFVVVTYDCPYGAVLEGRRQVAFDRGMSTLVDVSDPMRFADEFSYETFKLSRRDKYSDRYLEVSL